MPNESSYLFMGNSYKTATEYNMAILANSVPDAPSDYQDISLSDLPNIPPPVSIPVSRETSGGGGSKIAPDSWAKGVCDRCGKVWKLSKLAYQVINRQITSLRVCPSCLDKDNPQLWIGEIDVNDSSVLRDPRSDAQQRVASRGFVSWNPVRLPMPLMIVMGKVTVS